MAKVYADLMIKGLKTIDEVPEKFRDAVKDVLRDKLDNGQIDPVKYGEIIGGDGGEIDGL